MNKKFNIAGIGELLWDILPEAKQLGGAPLNFVYHATQLGCGGYVLSAVGNDELGTEIIDKTHELGLTTDYVQRNDHKTGYVDVKLDEKGCPEYIIHEPVAWDFIVWDDHFRHLAGTLDAVCWGTLAQRNLQSGQTIRTFLSHLKADCLKVFDINLRQSYYNEHLIHASLECADVLKINDEELPVLQKYYTLEGEVEAQINQLLERFNLQCIVYTMGSEGSKIITKDEHSYVKTAPVKVADTVGAGDSFTAAVICGLLKDMPIEVIHKNAAEIARYVCSQNGATPEIPQALLF